MFTNTDGSDLLYVADPAAHPEITLNYLKRPEDLATLTAGTQDKHKSTRTLGPLAKDSHCIDIRVHQWWPHVQSLCHSVSDAHPKVRQSVMYKHTQRRLAGQQVAPSSVHRSVTIIFNHIPQARSTPPLIASLLQASSCRGRYFANEHSAMSWLQRSSLEQTRYAYA